MKKCIYGLSGISQVGEVIFEGNKTVVKSLTTLVEPPHVAILSEWEMYTAEEEINAFYDKRINDRNYENKIDESRRKRALEQFEKHLK